MGMQQRGGELEEVCRPAGRHRPSVSVRACVRARACQGWSQRDGGEEFSNGDLGGPTL